MSRGSELPEIISYVEVVSSCNTRRQCILWWPRCINWYWCNNIYLIGCIIIHPRSEKQREIENNFGLSICEGILSLFRIGRFRFPRQHGFWTRDIASPCVIWRHVFRLKFWRYKQTWKQRFWGWPLTCGHDVTFSCSRSGKRLSKPPYCLLIDTWCNALHVLWNFQLACSISFIVWARAWWAPHKKPPIQKFT